MDGEIWVLHAVTGHIKKVYPPKFNGEAMIFVQVGHRDPEGKGLKTVPEPPGDKRSLARSGLRLKV